MARLFRPWILRLIDFDVMSSRAAAKDPLPDRHFVKVVRFRGCKKCDDYIVEVWKHREGFLERAKLLSG
ncbi:uncharacterized protein MYCGRDRAFT_106034 [Zymoseptoria tritici IPO323]|uniref:Uncharacterized protein n=1 Tax=Zymoseptoria tritici (strain CBS 115943 / IPO323) TaxID=336722 RepID=F9XMF1_ZYMTI|nr:uncharacterized protein MYCGRDRAFT_106034 [Zymoseptoria tritici IPO323]EGP83238.1 hypothetical protein MYCGRDRAFT_106034 [Zymoseptoria tritici IPO323]